MATTLNQLKLGLLMRNQKKETEEPANIAIGQESKELRFLERQMEYAMEVDRVLSELKITVKLIADLKDNCEVKISETTPKDLLVYYQGAFFSLVHQMKDKILQLVNLMTEKKIPDKPTKEKDISLRNILKNKSGIIDNLGIRKKLVFWQQENPKSSVAVVLRKRTEYHHKISRLRYNKDVLNLGFVETMENPKFNLKLSSYGLERIDKIKKESTERLFNDTYRKTTETLRDIEENINKISEMLISYYKLPITGKEVKEIFNTYNEMLESFEIKNKTSFEKISKLCLKRIMRMIKEIDKISDNKIDAIYLFGSVGRGEYQEGYSDFNIYLITSLDGEFLKKIISLIPYKKELSLKVFKKEEFLSAQSKKYRFIVFSDGLLLYGNDLLKDEKFPKAGLKLAFLLNNDILEKIELAEKWALDNPEALPVEISERSKRIVKDMINFLYGIVVSNKPHYVSSQEEKIASMKKMYPENSNLLNTLTEVSKYGLGTFESFKNLIIGFKPTAITNLKKMREVINELDK